MSGAPHPRIERPDTLPDAGSSDWTLLAYAVEAIVDRFTEPDPSADEVT